MGRTGRRGPRERLAAPPHDRFEPKDAGQMLELDVDVIIVARSSTTLKPDLVAIKSKPKLQMRFDKYLSHTVALLH
jgi:hypothetical protein